MSQVSEGSEEIADTILKVLGERTQAERANEASSRCFAALCGFAVEMRVRFKSGPKAFDKSLYEFLCQLRQFVEAPLSLEVLDFLTTVFEKLDRAYRIKYGQYELNERTKDCHPTTLHKIQRHETGRRLKALSDFVKAGEKIYSGWDLPPAPNQQCTFRPMASDDPKVVTEAIEFGKREIAYLKLSRARKPGPKDMPMLKFVLNILREDLTSQLGERRFKILPLVKGLFERQNNKAVYSVTPEKMISNGLFLSGFVNSDCNEAFLRKVVTTFGPAENS